MRSNEYPKGLAELSVKDNRKVLEGNELARFSIAIFHDCRRRNMPAAIENPHSSRLWCLPSYQHARTIRHVNFDWTDFCQDGTPWRKRTALLSTGLENRVKGAARQCYGSLTGQRCLCSRTLKPHQPLRGIQASSGRYFTVIAEPYLRCLCERLAEIFVARYGAGKLYPA